MATFALYPSWRQALKTLMARGLNNGDVLTKTELSRLFGLQDPVTANDHARYQLDFLREFVPLRDELLKEHRIALRALYGEQSYMVVPPNEQTGVAVRTGAKEVKAAMRKMVNTLTFIRHDELTPDQQRKNADALAKTSMLAGMLRRSLPR